MKISSHLKNESFWKITNFKCVVLNMGLGDVLEELILYLINTPHPNHRIDGKT